MNLAMRMSELRKGKLNKDWSNTKSTKETQRSHSKRPESSLSLCSMSLSVCSSCPFDSSRTPEWPMAKRVIALYRMHPLELETRVQWYAGKIRQEHRTHT